MKGKVLAVAVLAVIGLVLVLGMGHAQASSHATVALDNVFAALNSGQAEKAAASFAEDATAENRVRGGTYRGVSEVIGMLQEMQHENRRFDLISLQRNGDTITAKVEVSDRGLVWGTQTIEAVLKGDKVQSLNLVAFSLELWKIGK